MELIGTESILGGIDPGDEDLTADVDYAEYGRRRLEGREFVSHEGPPRPQVSPPSGGSPARRSTYKRLKAGLDTLDPRSGNELQSEKPVWHPTAHPQHRRQDRRRPRRTSTC